MYNKPIFQDRADAGRALADLVIRRIQDSAPLVLALPRGGVPVAYELARELHAELDVFLVRKLGFPGQEECAIGAIASGGVRVLNTALIEEVQLSHSLIDQITALEERELQRREEVYREGRAALPVRDRTVLLVDDGLATGATMKAASRALRLQMPKQIIVAVPVAAEQTCHELRSDVDEIICAHTPAPFMSVGTWYHDFSQRTDEDVQQLLKLAQEERLKYRSTT